MKGLIETTRPVRLLAAKGKGKCKANGNKVNLNHNGSAKEEILKKNEQIREEITQDIRVEAIRFTHSLAHELAYLLTDLLTCTHVHVCMCVGVCVKNNHTILMMVV